MQIKILKNQLKTHISIAVRNGFANIINKREFYDPYKDPNQKDVNSQGTYKNKEHGTRL